MTSLRHHAASLAFGFALAVAAAPLAAQTEAVSIASSVFVERQAESHRVLEPADRLRPGDRVVTIVSWKRAAPGGKFILTNPLPRSLHFQASAADDAEVSVDGGRSWGRIGTLHSGARLAAPEDVTHIRWRVVSLAPEGHIAYSAIVR